MWRYSHCLTVCTSSCSWFLCLHTNTVLIPLVKSGLKISRYKSSVLCMCFSHLSLRSILGIEEPLHCLYSLLRLNTLRLWAGCPLLFKRSPTLAEKRRLSARSLLLHIKHREEPKWTLRATISLTLQIVRHFSSFLLLCSNCGNREKSGSVLKEYSRPLNQF